MKVVPKHLLFFALFVVVLICLLNNVAAENPYRVLGVSKFHSMTHIKKVYKDLVLKYHPDKNKPNSEEESQEIRKKFYAIQTAFETIKEEKGLGINSAADGDSYEDGDTDFYGAIIKTALTTALYMLILYSIYYSVAFIMTCIEFFFNFFFYSCIVYSVVDLFFAHYFETSDTQNATCFLITIGIVWFKRNQRQKEEAAKVSDNANSNNNDNRESNTNSNKKNK